MAVVSRDTQLVAQQASKIGVWGSAGSFTASAYTQLVAANAERAQGVHIYNNNTVSVTSAAFIAGTSTPTADAIDAILIQPLYTTLTGTVLGRSYVFVPGTGPVWVKSLNAGILASLAYIEF